VTTIDIATGMPIGTITFSGVLASGVDNPLGVVLSPDGTRAAIGNVLTPFKYPGTSRVLIIDTATGTQIGDTVTIKGALSRLRWSADGSRVFVTTYITTATGGDWSIQEAVLKIA
jgi:DNA-binding beta-propeller fold protein YncE